jgi:hypothetical protein
VEEEKRAKIRDIGITPEAQDFFMEYGYNSKVEFLKEFADNIMGGDSRTVERFVSHLSEEAVAGLAILGKISFKKVGYIPDTGADYSGSRPGTIVEAYDSRTGKKSIIRANNTPDTHDAIWLLIYDEKARYNSDYIATPVLLEPKERTQIEALFKECFPLKYKE